MAEEISATDTENAMTVAMGKELGPPFYALYKEVVWVHAKWQEYRTLFGSESESVALLNRSAGFFFKIVQDGLWEDVLLHVARLTDPPRTAGRANLTVQMLPALITNEGLRHEVDVLIKTCLDKAEYAREHRNKRLAHRDLLHVREPDASPLSGISRAHVEEMLMSLRNLMNKIDVHFRDTTVIYDHFIANTGAQSLLSVLKRAEIAKMAK